MIERDAAHLFHARAFVSDGEAQLVALLIDGHDGLMRQGMLPHVDQELADGLEQEDRLVFGKRDPIGHRLPDLHRQFLSHHLLGQPLQGDG